MSKKIIQMMTAVALTSALASGCISVHKKEATEVPATVHHDTVVVP
jgi:outer membrane murein-binding lipoprotein Lpp